jgi:NADH-quinone oxidoreductase subunit L
MFLTFFGEYRGDRHPHESPPVMLVPLAVLALLSLGGGYFLPVPEFLRGVFHAGESAENPALMAVSVTAGLAGIALATLMYLYKPGMADAFAGRVSGFYKLVYNKYFVDEIYDAAVVRPVVAGSREVLWKAVDTAMIDGAVNGAGAAAREVGGVLQRIQSGNIRSYATWVVFGAVMLIFAMGLAGGLIR